MASVMSTASTLLWPGEEKPPVLRRDTSMASATSQGSDQPPEKPSALQRDTSLASITSQGSDLPSEKARADRQRPGQLPSKRERREEELQAKRAKRARRAPALVVFGLGNAEAGSAGQRHNFG